MTTMATIPALLAAASLFGGWEPAKDDGETHEREGRSGDWYTYTVVDPFGDGEGWFAAAPTVDGTGEVRFSCRLDGGSAWFPKTPMLTVFTDGLGRKLPASPGQWEGLAVQLKVDGGETRSTTGLRPNNLARMEKHPIEREPGDRRLDGNDVVRMLQGGGKAVLRIEDGRGKRHTFAVSLDGFREASGWVMGKCGWTGDD